MLKSLAAKSSHLSNTVCFLLLNDETFLFVPTVSGVCKRKLDDVEDNFMEK